MLAQFSPAREQQPTFVSVHNTEASDERLQAIIRAIQTYLHNAEEKLNASEESRTEVLRKKRETMRSGCAVTCGLLLVSLTTITASVIHAPLHDEPLHRDARGGKYSAVFNVGLS